MHFASDNTGPTHPKIIDAVARASEGYAMPYGRDPWAEAACDAVRETFEAPEARVYCVATGTGANALALGTLTAPWSTIFCHEAAHVRVDESNAPAFFAGGATFAPVAGASGKMDPAALAATLDAFAPGDVHTPARGPLTLTNVTEAGTVYTLAEIDALTAQAKTAGLPVHLDGARFANACAALGCSAAEMSWKRGIDVVSFGGTKNGCMSVEAVIFFDPDHAETFERQRMRGGHLFSKHRVLSAQMAVYADGLWLELAERANAAASRLIEGLSALPHVAFVHPPQSNLMFCQMPRRLHAQALSHGAEFYSWGDPHAGDPDAPVMARFVVDWSATDEGTDRFLDILSA
ncbi:MAG: beta-eliminating lyase-related protein [Pseudomonadota bacterium]